MDETPGLTVQQKAVAIAQQRGLALLPGPTSADAVLYLGVARYLALQDSGQIEGALCMRSSAIDMGCLYGVSPEATEHRFSELLTVVRDVAERGETEARP